MEFYETMLATINRLALPYTSLRQALEKENFKDVWSISKSRIKVCKDCEFRHICTDCRAYIDDPNDIYSKPLKCGYDPYSTR